MSITTILLGAIPVGQEKHGFEWLGYGYKAYQYYADLRSLQSDHPIYDMNNVKANYQEINFSQDYPSTGSTKTEYFNKQFGGLNIGGSYEMFSATVTGKFSAKQLQNYEYEFGTITRVRQLYKLTIPDGTPLHQSFQYDLNNMDPDQLFKRYGTHALYSFIVGGRFEYWSYIEKNTSEQNFDFEASLEAGFEKVFTAKGAGGSETTDAEKKVIDRASYTNWGGSRVEGTYQEWFDGINEQNAAIAVFEADSLVPLYDLVKDNQARYELLKAKHNDYMKSNAEPVMQEPDPEAPPKPAPQIPLKYGDHFRLQTEDGVYFVSVNSLEFSHNPVNLIPGPKEYYPKLRKANGVNLYFSSDKPGVINTEKSLSIRTTEDTKGYNYLGRFTIDNRAYYYSKGYDEELWVVTKVATKNTDKKNIFYGDVVEISMYKWPTYKLCKFGDYLSTTGLTAVGCENTRWKIIK